MYEKKESRRVNTYNLVLTALLTAIVVILQFAGASIRLGMFSVSLVLIPIVIGAAKCGVLAGGWLGLVFGVVVLLSGDAAPFMAISIPGTIITVLLKGIACGLAAGGVYKLVHRYMKYRSKRKIEYFTKKEIICENCQESMYNYVSRNSTYVAVLASAIVCPVVNTGIFLLGCLVFFFDAIMPKDANTFEIFKFMIISLVGWNFLFEMAFNIFLSPIVVRILNVVNKK